MLNKLPDLNRLGVFHEVFECESVSKAADRLHVTRSAVSQALLNLEREMGQELFTRKGRVIVRNEAARNLYALVHPLIERLREEAQGRALQAQELSGTLRIQSPPLFASRILVPLFAHFRRRHPLVRFELKGAPVHDQVRALHDDKVDFGIIDSSELFGSQGQSLVETKLGIERESLACTRDYFEKKLKGLRTFEALSQGDLIAYDPRGADLRAWFKSAFRKSPDQFYPVLCAEDFPLILAAIQENIGAGLVPEKILSDTRGLIDLSPKGAPAFSNRLSLVEVKTRSEKSALLKAFRAMLLAEFGPKPK